MIFDADYVYERNKLIKEAELYSNYLIGSKPKPDEDREIWAIRWNRCFHKKMNELWKEKGE